MKKEIQFLGAVPEQSGFKGTRKSTPFAATTAVEAAAKKALEKGLEALRFMLKVQEPAEMRL